ncbi:retrovirus-related Pol polyprotein from transposon 412 [Nephila pilipes]|uniref:Retrovirus-related Pol polyprotein from transposon 412 n=1 Tax=Nephila pilipes TaxID=299642 RepID=A0A8X6NSN8_NEPPI|nr:retrovirus-related Pol polyprotein from transposon 412 [Nephila pilipes]
MFQKHKNSCWTCGAAGHFRRNCLISRVGGNSLAPHQVNYYKAISRGGGVHELLQSAELDNKQRRDAGKLLLEFEDLFSRKLDDIGRTKMTRHRIDTGNHPSIKKHPRRLPFTKQEEVANLLMEMQQNRI